MSTQYSTGTATFTSGSQVVQGIGTNWTPAMNSKRITRAGSGIVYQIGSVNQSTQQITLTENYAGATESSVPYAIQIGETANYGFPEYDFQGVDPATFLNEFSWAVDGLLAPATSTTYGTVRTATDAESLAGTAGKLIDAAQSLRQMQRFGVGAVSNFDTTYNAAGQPGGLYSVFDDPNGIATYSAAVNLPYNGSYSGQIAIKMGRGLGATPSVYARAQNGSSTAGFEWSPTVEILHTGNLNVNEFGGIGANDAIATGFGASTSRVLCYLPINSKTTPVSISVVSTFKIVPFSGAALTGLTPTMAVNSSNKFCVLDFQGLTGININQPFVIETETASSKITVNF